MKLLKVNHARIFFMGMFMIAMMLCFSGQVHAEKEGDFYYTITDGQAQVTGYTGVGGDIIIPYTLGGAPVTSIGDRAFEQNTNNWPATTYRITGINMPETVTSIGISAFSNNYGLKTINLPSGITSISSYAFFCCSSLESLAIPQGITCIADNTFYNCIGLKTFDIPQSVKSIGDYAFIGCTGLTTINIPESIESIGNGSFIRCNNLTTFEVSTDNLNFSTRDGALYNKSGATLIEWPWGKMDINIPQDVTAIGDYVFCARTDLIGFILPEGITSIGNNAFDQCRSLTTMHIPDGVISIGGGAFAECNNLTSINIPNGVKEIKDVTFAGCTSLLNIDLPTEITSIGVSSFYRCTSLTSISLPDDIVYISDSAFSMCTGLTRVNLPKNLTSIGSFVFSNCYNLNYIIIPEEVTNIGDYAFSNCLGLTTMNIPQCVTNIGERAFVACTGLAKIQFNSKITTIYDAENTIPRSTTVIGYDLSTAKEYATKYGNNFQLIGASNNFILAIDEDNNGFVHSIPNFFTNKNDRYHLTKNISDNQWRYYLSGNLYDKLVAGQSIVTEYIILNEIEQEWGGSCFGLSASMALSKVKAVDINNFDYNTTDYHGMTPPKFEPGTRDLINYYQLAQYLPFYDNIHKTANKPAFWPGEQEKLETILNDIVIRAEAVNTGGEPFLITVNYQHVRESDGKLITSGHALVGNGGEKLPNGNYKITIVDPNDLENYIYLTAFFDGEKFSSFDIRNCDGVQIYLNSESWTSIGYVDLKDLSSIDIDGSNNTLGTGLNELNTAEEIIGTTLFVSGDNNINITNQNEEMINISSQGITGGLIPEAVNYIEKGAKDGESESEIKLAFPDQSTYVVTSPEKLIDISIIDSTRFASVNVTGASNVELLNDNSVKINGDSCNYNVSVPNLNSEGIIGISDDDGGNISIEQENSGIKVQSDNMDNINISTLTENQQTQITTSTDKNEILVQDKPDDQNDVVEIYVSENDDGQFNKKIGETVVIDPNERLLGDVDGNGEIQAFDALIALQIATGKKPGTPAEIKAADVDGLGGVQAYDALRILQYATGKITIF